MKPLFQLKAPGNLLLSGEYAITLEGGLGITMAVKTYSYIRCSYSGDSKIRFIAAFGAELIQIIFQDQKALSKAITHQSFSKEQVDKKERTQKERDFLRLISASIISFYEISENINLEGHQIEIDTRNFYYKDGRKIGLGSSAASVVLLMGLFYTISNFQNNRAPQKITDSNAANLSADKTSNVAASLTKIETMAQINREIQKNLFLPAVKAHRLFQYGSGSAYDISASLFGSVGLFTGGKHPKWKELKKSYQLLKEQRLVLVPSNQSVRTISGIKAFQTSLNKAPAKIKSLIDTSNTQNLDFEHCGSQSEIIAWIKVGKEIGIELGDLIGVSAMPPHTDRNYLVLKCLGAGDELSLGIIGDSSRSSDSTKWNNNEMPIALDEMGLSIEQ